MPCPSQPTMLQRIISGRPENLLHSGYDSAATHPTSNQSTKKNEIRQSCVLHNDELTRVKSQIFEISCCSFTDAFSANAVADTLFTLDKVEVEKTHEGNMTNHQGMECVTITEPNIANIGDAVGSSINIINNYKFGKGCAVSSNVGISNYFKINKNVDITNDEVGRESFGYVHMANDTVGRAYGVIHETMLHYRLTNTVTSNVYADRRFRLNGVAMEERPPDDEVDVKYIDGDD